MQDATFQQRLSNKEIRTFKQKVGPQQLRAVRDPSYPIQAGAGQTVCLNVPSEHLYSLARLPRPPHDISVPGTLAARMVKAMLAVWQLVSATPKL